MAIQRRKRTEQPRTVTPEQELAYAICNAVYIGRPCACMEGPHGTVCGNMTNAANAALRVTSAMPSRERL